MNGNRALKTGLALSVLLGAWVTWQIHGHRGGGKSGRRAVIGLRHGLQPGRRLSAHVDEADVPNCVLMYLDLTGRELWPPTNGLAAQLDDAMGGRLHRWKWVARGPQPDSGIRYHADGAFTAAETKARLEEALARAKVAVAPFGARYIRIRSDAVGPVQKERPGNKSGLFTHGALENLVPNPGLE